jgi:hypothetical protein
MKNIPLLLLVALLSFSAFTNHMLHTSNTINTGSDSVPQNTLTPQERVYAKILLTETEDEVYKVVNKLSEFQLHFKPSADKWSIAECVKHIAAAEKELWAMAAPALKQPANPGKRAGLSFTDEQLVKVVEDRSKKTKTFAALEPANTPYKTVAEALKAFRGEREKLIGFVTNTQADLRNHVLELPVGTYDSYQFILLVAAHSNRHTQQIREVMADTNFPKK